MKPLAKGAFALLFSTIASPALAIGISVGGVTGNIGSNGVSANIPSSATGGLASGTVTTANGGQVNANLNGVTINGVSVNSVANSVQVLAKLPDADVARIRLETKGLPEAYVQQMIDEATRKYNLTLNNGATKSTITGLNGASGGSVEIVTKKVSATPIAQDHSQLASTSNPDAIGVNINPNTMNVNINIPGLNKANTNETKGVVRNDVTPENAAKTLFANPSRSSSITQPKVTVTF